MNGKHVRATLLLLAALLGTAPMEAGAAAILFNDFSSAAGLQINGNAAAPVTDDANRKVLRLTPALTGQSGSTFSTNLISLASDASFSTAFRFRISASGGICDEDGCGADGIVFVVQTVSNTAGGAGGGIGYSGLPRSVGIEFDTWNNGGGVFGDLDNGNHVGVDINGAVFPSAVQVNLPTGGAPFFNTPHPDRMNNGAIWSAWVDYNGSIDMLEVRLAQGENAARPVAALITHLLDLPNVLQQTDAFAGFTSGTGSAFGNHDILSWQFNSTFSPIGVAPAPGSLALLGIALMGLGTARRRRRG